MNRTLIAICAAVAISVAACGSEVPVSPSAAGVPASTPQPVSASPASPAATAAPPASPLASAAASPAPVASPGPVDPANFVAGVDNPWFPLTPGTTLTYRGTSGGKPTSDVVRVTSATRVVDGVPCVVVRDVVRLAGVLQERTEDWYAQDREGNVWYFGEDTAELDRKGRVVSTEGSWESGVDGALPGIFMPASPAVGQSFEQEHYAGQAEDWVVIMFTAGRVKVPAGTYRDVLVTGEWTPLEPGVVSQKWYVKGIGTVKESDVAGGDEHIALERVTGP